MGIAKKLYTFVLVFDLNSKMSNSIKGEDEEDPS